MIKPSRRTAIDDRVWWVAYDTEKNAYVKNGPLAGCLWRTRKACRDAIARAGAVRGKEILCR